MSNLPIDNLPFDNLDGTIGLINGDRLNLLDPDPDKIHITHIAAALSKLCRFGGQCFNFYSVGEHSVHVSDCCFNNAELALAGLLHDASEAYMQDIVTPLKSLLPKYKQIEKRLQKVIFKKYNIDLNLLDHIHENADFYAAYVEGRILTSCAWPTSIVIPDEYTFDVQCWNPKEAESLFLNKFYSLIQRRIEE